MVAVDWKEGARTFYPQAVANTRLTAAITVKLIRMFHEQFGLDLKSVHLIGHSLGSHISGYIGHSLPGISRITGTLPGHNSGVCIKSNKDDRTDSGSFTLRYAQEIESGIGFKFNLRNSCIMHVMVKVLNRMTVMTMIFIFFY